MSTNMSTNLNCSKIKVAELCAELDMEEEILNTDYRKHHVCHEGLTLLHLETPEDESDPKVFIAVQHQR
jgi:hypothetical protein